MDLANHFRTIWRKRLSVLVGALAVAAAVFAWHVNQPAVFEAEARLRIDPASAADGRRPTGDDAVFLAEGYADRATTAPLLADAAARSDLGLTAEDVQARVTAEADPTVGTVTIQATGPSADEAAALADAVATALVAIVEEEQRELSEGALSPLRDEIAAIESTLATLPADDPRRTALETRYSALVTAALNQELQSGDQLDVVSPADPTTDPVSPRPGRDALLAFLLALVVNAELAVAVVVLRDRFSMRDLRSDVAATSGLPVLAVVPHGPPPVVREAFRELRTNLSLIPGAADAPPATLAVLGPHAGVGRTHTAVELARAASASSDRVLAVDGDLRQPAVHERLGVPLAPGLAEVLLGAELAPDVRAVGAGGDGRGETTLYVLAAGEPLGDPVIALTQHLSDRVLEPARERAALTIVDTPPARTFADAAAIAAQCDASILVIDARATSRRAVRDVLDRLRQVGVVPLGVVINRAPHAEVPVGRDRATGSSPLAPSMPPPSSLAPVDTTVSARRNGRRGGLTVTRRTSSHKPT